MAIQIEPIITDAVGQDMVTQLTGIKNNVGKNAAGISYAPGTSGISSTDVQGAIDSVAGIEADKYKNTQTYAKGDYCIYNNTLYKCTTAIATPEEWTAGHWTATRIASELTSVNNSLTQYARYDDFEHSSPTGTSVPTATVTEIASKTITETGTYLVFGFHEWSASVNAVYQDSITIGGSTFSDRNLSMSNGGGHTMFVMWRVNVTTPTTIKYQTYQASGSTQTTKYNRFSVVKIHD